MADSLEYQPRYKWVLTWPGEAEHDFTGFDGTQVIGRIFRTDHHPVQDLWKWNGGLPERFRGVPLLPNSGFVATAREASLMVEEYWKKQSSQADPT